jgi:hypothetical protein
METMAVVALRQGGPKALRWTKAELPPPGTGQIRIDRAVVGIEFADICARTGRDGLATSAAALWSVKRDGVVNATVASRFLIARAADVQMALQSRATAGALLLTICPPRTAGEPA